MSKQILNWNDLKIIVVLIKNSLEPDLKLAVLNLPLTLFKNNKLFII